MTQKTISLPVIPDFVAKFIEQSKYRPDGGYKSFKQRVILFSEIGMNMTSGPMEIYEWISKKGNFILVIKAIINGYEVEKETMYLIPTGLFSKNGWQYVVKRGDDIFALGCNSSIFKKCKSEFTEEELKGLPKWCQQLAVEVVNGHVK